MAFTVFPGKTNFWYPFDRRIMGGTMTRIELHALGGEEHPVHEIWMHGHVWFKERTGSKTISGVGFTFIGTDEQASESQNLRVSLHDFSNGFAPDAVELDSQTVAGADALSHRWQEVTGMSVQRSFGQELAIKFSFTGDMSAGDKLGVYAFENTADGAGRGFPRVATWTTAETIITGMVPALVLEFNDGTFGMLDGSVPAFAQGSVGPGEIEYGLQFRLPWNTEIDALCCFGVLQGEEETETATLVIYEGTTVLAEAEIDEAEVRYSSTHRLLAVPLNTKLALSKDTDYIVALRPNNGATTGVSYFVLADPGHRACFGDLNIGGVFRASSGDPWSSVDTTTIYRLGVRLCSGVAADPLLVTDAGSYTVTGFDTTLTRTRKLQADSGSYAVTGSDANLAKSTVRMDAENGSYFFIGAAADLRYGRLLSAASGSYTVTGFAASFLRGRRVDAENGSYAYIGSAATLTRTYALQADSGSYTVTGFAATLTHSAAATYSLSVDAGSYTVTGSDATLTATRDMDAENGFYFYIGSTAALLKGYALSADSGSYAVTGSDATGTATRTMTADTGSYTVSGFVATLDVETEGCRLPSSIYVSSPWRSMLPGPGDGTIDHHDIRQNGYYYCEDLGNLITADTGSYSVTGSAASLLRGYCLEADSGGYVVTGSLASLLYGHAVAADSGSYTVTGSDATLLATRLLSADGGSYTVTGSNADLRSTGTGVVISAETGNYSVTGFDATFTRGRIMSAESGSYAITGFDINPFFFEPAWVAGGTVLIDEIMEQ